MVPGPTTNGRGFVISDFARTKPPNRYNPRPMPHSSGGLKKASVLPLLFAATRAAAQTFNSGITTGTISNNLVVEASGIVASHLNPGILWTHNDSGNAPDLFPTTPSGANLGTYAVTGTTNTDWEDIALGTGPVAGTQYIYIGDIGDNNNDRSSISIYRVPEPTVSPTQAAGTYTLPGAVKFTFVYPDGPRNAESLFVDPLTNDIYIITKFDSPRRVYRAPYPQSNSGTITLQYVTQFSTANPVTAADISPDGEEILVRAKATGSGEMFTRPFGGSIADAFATTPISVPLLSEQQGEAIGFDPQGWGYYTTSEGNNPPIHYFDRVPAHAVWIASTGSFATASNWDIGAVPNSANALQFGPTATGTGKTYTVNFTGNVSSAAMIVHRDNVTLNLNGGTFAQAGYPNVDSVIVGESIGESGTLTMLNGTVTTGAGANGFSQIGRGVGASGVLNIGAGAKWLNSSTLLIGRLGTGTLNINAGGTATLSGVFIGGTNTTTGGTGAMNIGGGAATVSGNLKIWNNGSLSWTSGSLSAATVSLVGGGRASLAAGGDKIFHVNSISIDSSSQLDLSDNAMIVDYTGASPIASIQSAIHSGFASQTWTGTGISSSQAAAVAADSSNPHKTAMGFAEASDLFTGLSGTFLGQSVDNTSVLVRYTLRGDANLDGVVNALDFNALSTNFGSSGKRWSQGDYNYDGAVDTSDFAFMAANFGDSIPSPVPALGAAVPEPSAIALLVGLLRVPRRRRRNSAIRLDNQIKCALESPNSEQIAPA
jgi:T5SS/PEP-CTERM-associated repeat protein